MSKLTLLTLGDLRPSITTSLNNNFADISTAIENTLSRDGATPNYMQADLDMNSNDIINVGAITAENLTTSGNMTISGTFITTTPPSSILGASISIGSGAVMNKRLRIIQDGVYYWLPCSSSAF